MTAAGILGALLVKPALVIAVAAALTAVMRRSSAAARHAVWAGAIIATLTLPMFNLVLPPLRLTKAREAIESVVAGGTRRASRDAHTGASNTMRVPDGAAGESSADAASPPALTMLIIGGWMLGALLFGIRRLIAEIRARRIVRRARPVENDRLMRLFATVTRLSGVRAAIALRVTREITSPAVVGVIHPVVLLPTAAQTWKDADLTAVLVHELAHAARRDCLINRLVDLAVVLYWCNPVVRVAAGRVRAESERACDDRVVRGGTEPEAYAHLLVRLTEAARVPRELEWAGTAMVRPGELESRLLAILDSRQSRRPLPAGARVGFAALALAIATPTASLTLHDAVPTLQEIVAPEPDRLGDSIARPASERIALSPDAYRPSAAATRAARGPDSVLVRRLIGALDHEPLHVNDLVRDRSAWALTHARDGRLVEPLLESLRASDWRVQAYAAWALAVERPDPRAVPDLIGLMSHSVWRMRAMAAHALRESGDDRAEGAMDRALTDPAWQVRVEAVQYFGARGGARLSDRLEPRLRDRHIAVRLAAEAALKR